MSPEQCDAVTVMTEYGAAYFVVVVALGFIVLGLIGRWLDK